MLSLSHQVVSNQGDCIRICRLKSSIIYLAVSLSRKLFRRHVGSRADVDLRLLRRDGRLQYHAEPEVADLHTIRSNAIAFWPLVYQDVVFVIQTYEA